MNAQPITYFCRFIFCKNYQNTKNRLQIFISMCLVFACLALISKKVNKLLCNNLVTWSPKTTKLQKWDEKLISSATE